LEKLKERYKRREALKGKDTDVIKSINYEEYMRNMESGNA